MAAPIIRYSDPRLYGTAFVKPFETSYQWIRTVAHPWHPKCALIIECAVRAMKIATGTIALALTALLALLGRIVQILHYHSLSFNSRMHPPKITVGDIQLPPTLNCKLPRPAVFHETREEKAIEILRWGFDIHKTASGSKMAEAVYVSADDAVSVEYGQDQLILSLNLKPEEICYIHDSSLSLFCSTYGIDFSFKKYMPLMRQLFVQNGYRAVRYDLSHYGTEEAWAIYDPSCITITEVRPSLAPNARLLKQA